jgi:3-phosphoshikimate 1-carboxyvinyltransferase
VTARLIRPLSAPPDADVALPGSKSITNRALVASALASGTSVLEGILVADDSLAMVDCLGRLGVGVELDEAAARAAVHGTGGRFPPSSVTLDARLAATVARFLPPAVCTGEGRYRFDGRQQLRARPMGPMIDALRQLGASVREDGEPGHLPITVEAHGVAGGALRVRGDVSSQFASGLLLAGAAMRGGLRVEIEGPVVSRPYLDMTVAVMEAFGAAVDRPGDGLFIVDPTPYRPTTYAVEPDASAASYFFAAAAICGGRVRVAGLGAGSLQGDARFADVLERMGARVSRSADAIEVRGRTLRGIDAELTDLSDTAPTLAAVAAFAETATRVTGIGFVRRKETDRIAAVVTELRRCGIDAREEDDGFVVHPGGVRPARVETYGDHRMAMAFALLGLRVDGIEIADPDCVAKTFPGFWAALDGLRSGAG